MKFYRLTEKQMEEGYVCCYRFWDKEQHRMVQCDEPAVYSEGANCANPLCSEHGRFFGALNRNRDQDVKAAELFSQPKLAFPIEG